MKIKNKKRNSDRIFIAVIFSILLIYVMIIAYLLFFALITSLKSVNDINPLIGNNLFGLPNLKEGELGSSRNEFFKLSNFTYIFSNATVRSSATYYSNGKLVSVDWFGNSLRNIDSSFSAMVMNTIIYCVLSVGLKVFVTGISAFIIAKYKYRFGKFIYSMLLVCMTIPMLASQGAELTLFRNLGIYSTWFQLILQSANFGGMYFFVLYAFFEGFPNSYLEAAEIDGASQLKCLFTIVLPLSIKTFAAVALILFVQAWNQYEQIILYLPKYPTLSVMIYNISVRSNVEFTQKCAACMILALPVLILFLFFHRVLMGNVTLGGLKE